MTIKIPVPPDDLLDVRQPKKPSRVWWDFFEKIGIAGQLIAVLPEGNIFVGSAGNVPNAVPVSGDVTLTSSGVVTLQATSNTAEIAQDAVGGILVDTDTVDLAYNDGTPSITATARYQMTITADASGLKLVNDSTSPGPNRGYGTNSSGTKGWYHTLPRDTYEDETFTIPEFHQLVIAAPLTLIGSAEIVIEGSLVLV